MGKRETIERALGRYLREGWYETEPLNTYGYDMQKAYDALAESKDVIVIEAARLEQHTCCMKQHEHTEECGWDTIISLPTQTFFGDYRREIGFRGRHGTPGPYVLFGVPRHGQEK